VQDARKDRPLDRKRETAARQQIVYDIVQAQPLPQPPEQQRPADADAVETPRLHVRQHHRPLGMARKRGDQSIEHAAGLKGVLATESADSALAYALALADALDKIEQDRDSGGRGRPSRRQTFGCCLKTIGISRKFSQ